MNQKKLDIRLKSSKRFLYVICKAKYFLNFDGWTSNLLSQPENSHEVYSQLTLFKRVLNRPLRSFWLKAIIEAKQQEIKNEKSHFEKAVDVLT